MQRGVVGGGNHYFLNIFGYNIVVCILRKAHLILWDRVR